MIDYIILFPLILWLFWSNHQEAKREHYDIFQNLFLQVLLIYHICFAFFYHAYILDYGGDALRYWNLSAAVSNNPGDWMDYFGTSTYFIQWVNFYPGKVLGLRFLSGNILYACFSFLGIRLLFKLVNRIMLPDKNYPVLYVLFGLVFLLPNLHFWTSGVGKESLIFVGWVSILSAVQMGRKYWLYGLLGIGLLFMVRPVTGLVGLGIGLVILLFSAHLDKIYKPYLILIGLILASGMVYQVIRIAHVEEISWEALLRFRSGQFEFLKGFHAGTEVPMADYSLLNQLWTLFFRPFWADVQEFWSFWAAMENTFSLFLIAAGFISFIFSSDKKIPVFILAGLVIVFVMSGIYLFNLNNLGLMMRMKSTLMIFLHLWAVYWVISNWKYYNCEK